MTYHDIVLLVSKINLELYILYKAVFVIFKLLTFSLVKCKI